MPYSADEGKTWIREQVRQFAPCSLLDIGPGAGTYAKVLAGLGICEWTCVEIFEPYVERFGLRRLYDTVIVADARTIELPGADVVILGDVLEHMNKTDALRLWARARRAANKCVVLSLPIIEYPQGAWEGNPHEAHLHTWSDEQVLTDLDGIVESWTGTELGCYVALSTPT